MHGFIFISLLSSTGHFCIYVLCKETLGLFLILGPILTTKCFSVITLYRLCIAYSVDLYFHAWVVGRYRSRNLLVTQQCTVLVRKVPVWRSFEVTRYYMVPSRPSRWNAAYKAWYRYRVLFFARQRCPQFAVFRGTVTTWRLGVVCWIFDFWRIHLWLHLRDDKDIFSQSETYNTPFTRYNRLSVRLYNRFHNQLYRVNKHPTGCQTGFQTGLTSTSAVVH